MIVLASFQIGHGMEVGGAFSAALIARSRQRPRMSEIAQPRSSDERCDAKGDIGQSQSPALLTMGLARSSSTLNVQLEGWRS